ncbi:MAG: diacylglycerol kinase family protein [Patescibacteria group bacterium]
MIHHIRHRLHKHTISFKHAIEGVLWSFRTQPNYLIHLTLSIISIVFGFIFGISKFDWLIIIILISVGLAIETINSSIEQTLDCVTLEKREDVKIAKDAAAAAMLLFSVGALICAIIIFWPYFNA